MAVTLPTGGVRRATPRYIDRGGILTANLGGKDQRLDRLGSRWGVDVDLYPMKAETARIWIARLIRGMRERALLKFPQPGLVVSVPADSAVFDGANGANASAINIKTVAGAWVAGQRVVAEGQFISCWQGGQRFLYQATQDAYLSAGFGATVNIQPNLRVSHANLDGINILPQNVMIEGYIKGERRWDIDEAKIYGLSFSIEECQ